MYFFVRSRATLFAPIASSTVKTGNWELEDLSCKAIHPGYFTDDSYIYYTFIGNGLVEYSEVAYYGNVKRIYDYKIKILNNLASHQHCNNVYNLRGQVVGTANHLAFLEDNNSSFIVVIGNGAKMEVGFRGWLRSISKW